MRANLIVIFQVRQQYVTKMPLSEHNNVVKAFPSDRIDQPFGASILPRGAWRRWSVANAHRSKSSDENFAIGPIAIADQIVGSPFPAESFRNLICDPFCGRMRCDAEPYDLSSAVPHDQQSIEQTKRDCRHDEQIHRGDAVGMIVKECLPSLGRRASSPGHIFSDARLSDLDAELEQLSMDMSDLRGLGQAGVTIDTLIRNPSHTGATMRAIKLGSGPLTGDAEWYVGACDSFNVPTSLPFNQGMKAQRRHPFNSSGQ